MPDEETSKVDFTQPSGPIQAGTSCNSYNKDSGKKVNKGNLKVKGGEITKDHNDDDISIHVSRDEIEDNNANKNKQGYSNISGRSRILRFVELIFL